jgi:hypothetical protein
VPAGLEIGPRGSSVCLPNVLEGPGVQVCGGPTVANTSWVQGFQVAQGSKCTMGPAVPNNCAWFVDSSKQLDR